MKHLFLVEIDHGPTTYDPEDMARVLAEAIKAAVRDGYVLLAHTKDGLDSAKGFTVIPWSPEGPSRVYDATQVRF